MPSAGALLAVAVVGFGTRPPTAVTTSCSSFSHYDPLGPDEAINDTGDTTGSCATSVQGCFRAGA